MNRTLYILLLSAITCLAGSCKKDTTKPDAPALAYLMMYNGSPEYFGQNSTALVNNADYGTRNYNDHGGGLIGAFSFSRYSYIDTGIYRLAFTDAAYQAGHGAKLAETWLHFNNQQHYTIYLTDSLGYYTILSTQDDVAPDEQQAKIRLVHLSPDAGKVSLHLGTVAVKPISQVGFKEVTGYVAVQPDIKPGIRIIYNDPQTGEETMLIRKSFPMEAGKCYTMVLRGYRTAPDGNINKTINLSTITNF
ncbi:MAG: DUF4397 domain-containing protein [Candidatus Pseudobacter hemicellulosilyticus]|uniref:DUF4397 domain-containing protein n=1 Tax=Candidatus Pseudobacter hemicellulosilyticus TaxID=3121375 RepID=A0AAJ5WZD3_9BACT|nr:MAG: DUF4397 domain-containing protein [Pseudobacter sp.]